MKKILSNEKGLTLIELLASITILSIVIVTFLAFFTNAFRFNSINDDSLTAMNIAREYQALIKTENHPIANILINNGTYSAQEEDFNIVLSVIENETTNTFNKLHVVHIKVERESKLISETYTYLESGKD